MNNKKTGLFIAELRKEKGMTQKMLAEKLFVTDRAVSKWERGIGYPDITIITKLAEILNASVNEILYGEKNLPTNTENTIEESVNFYTKITKQKILKKILIFVPLGLMIFWLALMIFTEVNHGFIPFTNQQMEMDWPSFSKYASKKQEKKFFTALKEYDFDTLESLIYPKDLKSVHKHIEELRVLKEKGIKFGYYTRESAGWDSELIYSAQIAVNVEYNKKIGTIIFLINKMGKRVDINAVAFYNHHSSESMIEDEIQQEIMRAFNIDYKNIKINN